MKFSKNLSKSLFKNSEDVLPDGPTTRGAVTS